MKSCDTCHLPKELGDYNKNRTKKDGLNSICKSCSRLRSKRYYQENKPKHLKVIKQRKKKVDKEHKEFILEYLATHPCVDCGFTHPAALHFDHVRGIKKYNISYLIGECSWETLKDEIAKCEVRCANCHMIKTAKDFNWYRKEFGDVA